MDPTWRELIGATNVSIREQDGCLCLQRPEDIFEETGPGDHLEILDDGLITTHIEGVMDCDALEEGSAFIWCRPSWNVTVERVLSDGFILRESARNAPGATPDYVPRLMDGSNHFQMRNDSELERAVKLIFESGLNGPFFKTDGR